MAGRQGTERMPHETDVRFSIRSDPAVVPARRCASRTIPAQHAGMASGFLMTGHEIGAALGVAVLSAVATTAGSLTAPAGVVDGFSASFAAAAVIAAGVGVVAYLRMPAARMDGAAAMHMHH